jgi:signal transduction histidine kinase
MLTTDGHRDTLLLLLERAPAIVQKADMRSLVDETVDAAIELTGAGYGAFGIVNNHGRLVEFHHRGVSEEIASLIGDPPVGRGILGDIMRHGVVVRTDNIASHSGYTGMPPEHPHMSSFLGAPVKVRDMVFGNLYVTNKTVPFSALDETVLKTLATAAGAGINLIRMGQELRDRAVDEDRDRIARDVHDSIIQNLFAVGLGLQARSAVEDNPELRAVLGGASTAIDDSITELRRLIHDLHDDPPTRGSLAQDVQELVERLAKPYVVPVEVSVSGNIPPLDISLIDDVLQIVREAVSNALRHSSATSITVSLTTDDRSLLFVIADNGHGFNVAKTTWGLGLTNMRTRARRVGGEIVIDSNHARGTLVETRILLPGATISSDQPPSSRNV